MVRGVKERDFDVVVFGTSGVTGRQVAAYLGEQSDVRWAAAARDAAKSEQVCGEIGVSAPETIVADIKDPDSLAAMAARTRVVLNLVGPYTHYGQPVIEACVGNGAHYADLTGEIPFVRKMIDAYDTRAREAGVKVVEVCGFEALPADMSVMLAAETARERWGENLSEADLEVTFSGGPTLPRPSEMLSGGTLQSLAAVTGADNAEVVTDPAALITDPARAEQIRRRSPINVAPRRGSRGAVIAPMAPAAFINPAVIQRTAALVAAEQDGGADPFRYREGIALRGGSATLALRYAGAGMIAGTQAAVGTLARSRPEMRQRVGRALTKVLPSSGFGPKGAQLEGWGWEMTVEARTAGGHEVRVEIEADGHPGYLSTARMLGEAGLLMSEPGATPDRAGCLTPATALGTGSAERFERARMRFSVAP
jgi:short subunit dehydrogenase-like uncharacterized protein